MLGKQSNFCSLQAFGEGPTTIPEEFTLIIHIFAFRGCLNKIHYQQWYNSTQRRNHHRCQGSLNDILPSSVSQKARSPAVHPDSDLLTHLGGRDTRRGLKSKRPTIMRHGSHKHRPCCLEDYVFHLSGEQPEVRHSLQIFLSPLTSTLPGTQQTSQKVHWTSWNPPPFKSVNARETVSTPHEVWFLCWQPSWALPLLWGTLPRDSHSESF